jgi:endonuclease/exonuclease/phosphatase (EEP) superfamily protein YafD
MKEELPTRPGFLRLRVGLLGWVQAAGAVAGGATVAGFLGRFWWGLDLFSHFRVQYCFGLGAVALILLIVRRFRMALMMAAFSVLNLGLVVPLYVGASSPGHAPGPLLRAMLINVNTRSGDPVRVARAIREANPDIVALEEISSEWIARLEPELREWPHKCREPREDNFGIGLFSKFPLDNPRLLNVGEAGVPTMCSSDIRVVDRRVGPAVGSDHFPVIVDLALPGGRTGGPDVRP